MALISSVRCVASTVADVDNGVTPHRSLFLERRLDPGGGQAEGRLGRVHARQRHLLAGRIHDHVLAVPDLAAAGFHFLDLDHVTVGVELDVVEDAHRRHDEAHFGRERAAQRLDLLGEPFSGGGIDQRQQRIAELDFQVVHLQRRRHRLFRRRRLFGVGLLRLGRDRPLAAAIDHVSEARRAAAEREKRDHRYARQQRHHQHHRGRHAERLRIAGKLLEQRLVGGAGDAGLGDQQAGGDRNDQRRHLRDQAVADAEQRVGVGGLGEAQPLLHDADDHAADHIDQQDEQAGDGVAAHEFRGAIHGAEEAGFVFQSLAPPPRVLLVDQAGGKIGVDRHLFARHRIRGESVPPPRRCVPSPW